MAILLAKGNRFKAEDVKNGQIMTLNSTPEWVKDSFKQPDGSQKETNSLVCSATVGEVTKDFRIPKGTKENFTEKFGNDTSLWVGKQGMITLVPTEKGKSILLTPVEFTD